MIRTGEERPPGMERGSVSGNGARGEARPRMAPVPGYGSGRPGRRASPEGVGRPAFANTRGVALP